MDDIYSLTDAQILQKIGSRLKSIRLKQNMTQQEISNQSMVSVSTIKKIEDGRINSFDSLLRLMRILGKLDLLQELTEEEKLSPNEYYAMINSVKKHQRNSGHTGRHLRMSMTIFSAKNSSWSTDEIGQTPTEPFGRRNLPIARAISSTRSPPFR